MYQDLYSKTALITGAGSDSGIGFGIASALASHGMNIVLADISSVTRGDDAHIHDCCNTLEKNYGIQARGITLDVTSDEDIARAVSFVRVYTPSLHALINNAGVMLGPSNIGMTLISHWEYTLKINLNGPFKLIHAFLPLMQRGSVVLNMASRAGKRPSPGYSAYSVSKAGLIMLTKCLAVEYAAEGIRANAICPGQIMTELNRIRFEREAQKEGISYDARVSRMVTSIPCGRMGTPVDTGQLAAFLVSEQSSYITGQAFNICGGQLVEL